MRHGFFANRYHFDSLEAQVQLAMGRQADAFKPSFCFYAHVGRV